MRWRRLLTNGIAITLAFFAGVMVVAWARVRPVLECRDEQLAIQRMFESHERPRARRSRESGWNEALSWLRTASGNIFFAPHRNTLEATRQFRQDIEPRMGRGTQPTVDDFRWVWGHLRASSHRAAQYIDRYQEMFDLVLERAEQEERQAALQRGLP